MLEKEFYISTLIAAELEESLSPEEASELQDWKDASAENLEFYNNFTVEEQFLQEFKKFNQTDTNNIWELTSARLKGTPATQANEAPVRPIRLWPRMVAVAAAVATVTLGVWLYYASNLLGHSDAGQNAAMAMNDIVPGKVGATLTLSNGRKIRLSDFKNGELAKEAGVVITKSEDGNLIYKVVGNAEAANKLNTLSTAKGETYEVHLPDGSLVHLNAASSLTYRLSLLENGKRNVKLTGEGYFEVAKDAAHPFVVTAKGQEVEVLGTHFNINAYDDEDVIKTTLLEGSVKVDRNVVLKPGQQAINKDHNIQVRLADLEETVDWKNGDFYLNHVAFKTAMRKIARWYDMQVIYDESVPDNMESGGWISRDKPLSAVLKSIESSGLVRFKVEGRKIYVVQ